ncbi:hypothetical protein GGI23_000257 [Coemansia sp. RSA 2559]|nr:hypothetical protein GGI23_000257 [Coemansia sp. RSA 2559]KAJ2869463.1 hypothetical protein GGI22_000229 [Coemansia erecta]
MFRDLQLPVTRAAQGVRRIQTWIAQAHKPPWTESAKHQLLALISSAKRQGAANEDWDKVADYVQSIPPKAFAPWTPAESQQLAQYIQLEFQTKQCKTDWNQVGNHFGRTATSCFMHYYQSWRRTQMGLREANDDLDRELRIMATELGAAKQESRTKWTDDEIARLIEARGTQEKQRFREWGRVACHVGTGRTPHDCSQMWSKLRYDQKRKAALERGVDSGQRQPCNGVWTAEEVAQMDALAMFPSPRKGLPSRTKEALALFPHKDPAHVRLQLNRSIIKLNQRNLNARVLKTRQQIREMVDSARQEDVDWKAISEAVGLTELKCRQVYDGMEQVKSGARSWTRAETDRLLASLMAQKDKQGKYDWYAVAHAVGTRTRDQCYRKYFYDKRVKQAVQ